MTDFSKPKSAWIDKINLMKKIFIGVAWPYVNGDLHPGHLAGNFLPADIFARFHRYLGHEVLMVSGSDCYGTPITVEADKRGKSPEEIVQEYRPHHLELFKTYDISFDLYTQTTTENHKQVVQDLLLNLAKKGYLCKGKIKQYFSASENKFLPDRYVEGECRFCGYKQARGDQCEQCGQVLGCRDLKNPINKLTREPVALKETEHLFFNWPKLQPFLERYVKERQKKWKKWISHEVGGWLKIGLQKRAITRDINWGIPIPNDQLPKDLQLQNAGSKRIYVWFEAVIGYLSAAKEYGANWKEFWYPENKESVEMYNFMGKDNVVFHALFWPGQLYGAYGDKIKLPDLIAANQYLNLEGKKFSKSRGVTIDSLYLAKTYGTDPVRFYLTYIMPEYSDANFSWSDFVKFNNTVLIGTLGNLFNRTLVLVKKYGLLKDIQAEILVGEFIKDSLSNMKTKLGNLEFKVYAQNIIELAKFGNEYINKEEPWNQQLADSKRQKILTNCLLIVLALQAVIKPLLPQTYTKLSDIIGVSFDKWPDLPTLKEKLSQVVLKNVEPLFSKIDPEIVEKERSKINS